MRISGRLGRKASMATIKEWEHGDHSLSVTYTHVDYGAASALTRMGVTGGVVRWVRVGARGPPRPSHVWESLLMRKGWVGVTREEA